MAIIAKGTMKKDEKAVNQQQNQPVSPTVGATPTGSAQQGMGAAQPNQQKTNIQSFTAANKEGTERIGSALKTGLNRDVNVQNKATEQSIRNVRNAVDAANKNAQAGQQFIQQVKTPTAGTWSGQAAPQAPQQPMVPRQTEAQQQPFSGKISMDPPGDINLQPVNQPANTRPTYIDKGFTDTVFDAEAIAADEEKAKLFQGIRTGETLAADKAAQEKAAEAALAQKEAYNKFTQDRLNQLRNNQASGQDALLQDYLGKYMQNYTKGQSALDKSLLRLDQNNTLSKAKQDLKQRQATDVTQAGSKIDQQKQAIAANLESTKTLKDDLQNAITQKVQEYESLVGNDERLANANKFRADEIAYLEEQLSAIKNNEAVERNVVEQLELDPSRSLYNALDLGIDSVYNVDRSNLQNANQVATAAERAKANALYRLAGMDMSGTKIRPEDIAQISGTSVRKEGNTTEANRLISEREKQFMSDIVNKQLQGQGEGSQGWKATRLNSFRMDQGGSGNAYQTDKTKELSVAEILNELAKKGNSAVSNVEGQDLRSFVGSLGRNGQERNVPYSGVTLDKEGNLNFNHNDFSYHEEATAQRNALAAARDSSVQNITDLLNQYLTDQGRYDRIKFK